MTLTNTQKVLLILAVLSVIGIIAYVTRDKWMRKDDKKDNISDNLVYELNKLAKSISDDEANILKNIIDSLNNPKNNYTEEDKQKWLRVYKGILLAKKDKKWDDKNKNIDAKKVLLISYGVDANDIDWFIKKTS